MRDCKSYRYGTVEALYPSRLPAGQDATVSALYSKRHTRALIAIVDVIRA